MRPDRDAALEARLRREGERLRTLRAGCPSPELLVARATGALEPAVQLGLDAHLDSCDACRRLAADIGALNLASPEPATEARVRTRVFGGRSTRAGLLRVAAAAVLAGVAIGWRVWPRAVPAPPEDRTASAVTPAVESPAVTNRVVALWEIAPAPVRVPLSTLGPTRSESAGAGAGLIDALGPYQDGDYARATQTLSEWVRVSPASGEGYFYLGVSQLLTGEVRAAAASLARAQQLLPAPRRREAGWYQAAAEQRSGDVAAARARLRTLCAEPGAYQTEACAADAVLR